VKDGIDMTGSLETWWLIGLYVNIEIFFLKKSKIKTGDVSSILEFYLPLHPPPP